MPVVDVFIDAHAGFHGLEHANGMRQALVPPSEPGLPCGCSSYLERAFDRCYPASKLRVRHCPHLQCFSLSQVIGEPLDEVTHTLEASAEGLLAVRLLGCGDQPVLGASTSLGVGLHAGAAYLSAFSAQVTTTLFGSFPALKTALWHATRLHGVTSVTPCKGASFRPGRKSGHD